MHTNGSPAPKFDSPDGLPPVEPPSGRFLAQLFIIPLLIVTAIVAIALAGLWWSRGRYGQGDSPDTDHFTRDLASSNEDIWWRSANELAQVIKRPESLVVASSPKFALDLADKLKSELAELERDEQAEYDRQKGLSEEASAAGWQRLDSRRKRVLFLLSVQGDFTIPTGVPLLSKIARKENGPEPKGLTLRRRRAVWALANLGQNLKRFKDLSVEQQERVRNELAAESQGKGDRADWARVAHDYLFKNQPLGVDATLAACARSEDTYLRLQVAFALNFWDGPLVVPTLRQLANDDGHGTRLEITGAD
jgi:hypothetical protein